MEKCGCRGVIAYSASCSFCSTQVNLKMPSANWLRRAGRAVKFVNGQSLNYAKLLNRLACSIGLPLGPEWLLDQKLCSLSMTDTEVD